MLTELRDCVPLANLYHKTTPSWLLSMCMCFFNLQGRSFSAAIDAGRIAFEIFLVTPWSVAFHRGVSNTSERTIQVTGTDCRYWVYTCRSGKLISSFSIVWGCMIWAYGMQFYWYTYKTRHQLRSQPYSQYRAPNILLQLQVSPLSEPSPILIRAY